MIRVVALIRPHRLEQVKSALAALGISGLSVTEVRGTGNSEETTHWLAGQAQVVALPMKSKLEVVAPEALVESLVQAILENAHTGEEGDGKIFLEPVEDALRIRTGERGDSAI